MRRNTPLIELPFPFWIKPVKAQSSLLGYRVRNRKELDHALSRIRAGIHRFSEPMNVIMGYAELADELLNMEIFTTLRESQVLIEQWLRHYNAVRPHPSTGYRPPAPETI